MRSAWDRAIFIGPTCLYSRSLRPSPQAPARKRSTTAQHMLRQLVSPGNRPIAFVLRFTSSSDRSNRFDERNGLRSRGKCGNVVDHHLVCSLANGVPRLTVRVDMLSGEGNPSATRDDVGIYVCLPFSWIAEVWARGLAVMLGRFVLAVEEVAEDHMTLLAVSPDFGEPAPVTITVG